MAVICVQSAPVPAVADGADGGPGLTATANELAALVPQELPAVTVIFPFCPALPVVTSIELVEMPCVILQPVGLVQV